MIVYHVKKNNLGDNSDKTGREWFAYPPDTTAEVEAAYDRGEAEHKISGTHAVVFTPHATTGLFLQKRIDNNKLTRPVVRTAAGDAPSMPCPQPPPGGGQIKSMPAPASKGKGTAAAFAADAAGGGSASSTTTTVAAAAAAAPSSKASAVVGSKSVHGASGAPQIRFKESLPTLITFPLREGGPQLFQNTLPCGQFVSRGPLAPGRRGLASWY